jgi:AraC-like DNA-binding protein
MSSSRQPVVSAETGLGTVVTSWELGDGMRFDRHAHPTHQLTLARRSSLAMGVGDRTWVLPRSRALWVPANVIHTLAPIGTATTTTLYFEPTVCPIRWTEPTVVAVDDLVVALVDRLLDAGLSEAARTRSERVLFDVLEPMAVDDLALALPHDERARQVAEALLVDPSDARTLAEWGRAVGASERTLLRAFRADTGLGFQAWRTRARLTVALRLLLTDTPVTTIASSVGYASTSAFCAAFRRTMGAPASSFRAAGVV